MTAKERLQKQVEQDRKARGATAKETLRQKVEADRTARTVTAPQTEYMPFAASGFNSLKQNLNVLQNNAGKSEQGSVIYDRTEEGRALKSNVDKAREELYLSGGRRENEDKLREAEAAYQNWWNANPDLHEKVGRKATAGEEANYQAGKFVKGFGNALQGTIGFVDKLVGDDLAILGSLVDATTGGKTQFEKPIQQWADNALQEDILGADKFGQNVENSMAGIKPSKARDFVGGISESAGAMLPAIATGGATSAAGLGAGTTQALNYLVFGSGAAGNAAKEAIANGADMADAVQYGLYSGMLEVLTENMFAGIVGMNPSGALDDIVKRLKDKGIAEFLTNTLGEGVEEGLVTFLTPYVQRATYNPEAASATWREMMEAFASGAAMSFLMNSATAAATGSLDPLIGSTAGMNEQQVLQDKYGRVEEETVADVFRNGSVTPMQKPAAPAQEEVKEPTAKERLLAAVEADREKAEAAKAKEAEEEIPRMELKGIEEETESDTQPAVQSAPAAKPAPTGTATERQRMQARAIGDMVEAGAAAKISPAALGIENGGDIESITVLEKPLTEMFDFSEASEIAERAGYEPVYFSGMLQNANGGTSRWGIAGNKLYIQADSANYTAADIAKEAVERSKTNETISDRGQDERYAGLSAGRQTERVSQQGGSQARRAAARANKAASYAAERASDYISNGSTKQTLKIIPAADYDGELKGIDKALRNMGAKKVYFTVGSIGIVNPETGESANVSGVYDSDSGVMMVRADSNIYTAQQLAMHEAFHYIADADSTIREDAYNRLLAEMSEDEMEELAARYQVAFGNVYGDNVDAYVDEILADAYAGINRANLGADRYRSTVNSAVMAAARPETEQRQTNGPNERYTFGGEGAKTANYDNLRSALDMEAGGIDKDAIRRETGWFKGADGKWRFEINDSSIKLAAPEQIINYMRLGELIDAPELLAAYPDMADIEIVFQGLDKGVYGQYNRQFDSIDLAYNLKNDPEALLNSLVHEMQHAIQSREHFAHGATVAYWERQLQNGFNGKTQMQRRELQRLWQIYNNIRDNEPEFFEAMVELESITPDVPRGAINWDTLEKIEEDPIEWQRYDAAREALEEQYGDLKVWDFTDLRYKLIQMEKNTGRSATDLYYDTAGEIEARDAARRRTMTAEQRRATMPNIGNEDTVFAENSKNNFSIKEINGENGSYGLGVLLDTNIFDGIRPREWGRVLSNYVYKKLAGAKFTMYDEAGNAETVYLARENDRVKKDGAKNSHKVIDKLARYKGDNIRALATVHLPEALVTSKNETSTYEHSHKWMDEKGWIYRTAYLQDRNGNIYEATLNIADGRDRRILYDITNIRKIDTKKEATGGVVSSTETGRDSHTNGNFQHSIIEEENNVKQRFSVEKDSAGRELTEGQKEFFANSKATDWQGRLLTLYHQTENEFTVFDTRRSGAGSRDEKTPFGIFLKSSDTDIGLRGKKQMELYANIENPLIAQNREDLTYQLRRLSSKYDDLILEHEALDNEYHQKFEDAKTDLRNFMTEWRKNNPDASRRALYDVPEFDRLYNAEESIIEEWTEKADALSAQAKEVLTQALRDAGYDGVFLYNDAGSWGRNTDAYIALDPEQVKNVDNVNPTNNPDIRYSTEEQDEDLQATTNENAKTEQKEINDVLEVLSDEARQRAREAVLAEREATRQQAALKPAATADEVVERKIAEAKAEAAEKAAPELLAVKLSNSRGEFTGSAALEKLGIKVVNSIGKYANVKQLLGNARAGRSIARERKKAEIRLKVTAKEKNFARGIANGIYTESDIPEGWDKRTVMEMSEWYMAERNFGESYIDLLKQAITVDVDAATAQMFEGADESKVPPAIVLNHRTAQRNMLNIFGDKGKEINKWLFDPVNQNEAERIRFINRQFDQVRTFADQTGKQRALNKAEREMVQRVIEGRVVEDALAKLENREDIETAADSLRNGEDIGDIGLEFGLTLEEQEIVESLVKWQDVQDQLEAMDKVIIYNAVDKYSALFDSYYEAINDFLAAHGYQPIGFIKGYVPHLQPEENQTALQNVFQKLGLNTDVSSLPTSIAGLTGDYKPNKKWNPYFLHRNSTVTQFDIIEAFESYVSNMADVLYHADDIMRIRSAVKYFRRTYSPEEIRNSIEWAENLRTMPKDEKIAFLYDEGIITSGAGLSHADAKDMLNKYIEEQYGKIENTSKFNNLVTYLENYANILAGKQSIADRGSEYSLGRKILNAGNRLTRIFSRANVAGNFSSALNQSAQLPTILAENGLRNTSAAFKDIITGNLRKAGWAEDSDFLTGKRGVSFIVDTPGEMVINFFFKPLEIVDSLMSTMAVRGAYLDGIKQGMSHEAAMQYADKKAAAIMGDRTKGAKPLAFEAKNPISSMVHLFQIEVLNSWDHIARDLPQDFRTIAAVQGKKKAVQALAGVLSKMLVYSFVLNRLAEKLYGGTPAPFDIFGLTANFIASGQELSTNAYLEALIDKVMLELFGMELFGSDEDERMQLSDGEFEWEAAAEDLGYNISNGLPFLNNLSALLGLGDKTLPLPDVITPLEGVYEGIKNKSVTEALDSALQLAGEILPAGRQAVKTYTGAKMIAQGGKMKGFGEDARLQYPVRRTAGNITQALLFGASGLQENQDFYASGRNALTTKETALWKTLVANGADEEDAYDAIYSTKGEDVKTYEKLLTMAAPLEWSNGLKYDAMAGVTSDSFGYRLNVLESNDIDALEYAEVTAEMYDIAAARIAELPEENRPETVTISQEDAEKALKASNLSKQEKAIIWQMTDASWSEKNNPFSNSIGKRVKAEYKEIKEQAEEEKRKEEEEDEIPRMQLRGLD